MEFSRRERRLNFALVAAIAGVLTFLLVNVLVNQRTSRAQREDTRWVIHTHEVLRGLDRLQGQVRTAEGSLRGYALTRESGYVPTFEAAVAAATQEIAALGTLVADNPGQTADLATVRGAIAERFRQLEEVRKATVAAGVIGAQEETLANSDQETVRQIESGLERMGRREQELLALRLTEAESNYRRGQARNLAASLATGLALALMVFAVERNLRARKAAANEIVRQRELLAVTLKSIGDGVITTDARGSVTFLNGEAERLTGVALVEAQGRPLESIFHIVNESTRKKVENPALRALREGIVVGLANHTILISRDGTEWPIDDSAAPIRDARGTVVGVVLVFRDVAEERSATNELRKLAAELSEADRRKNQFLAMLAHELRNPLAAIRNSAAVLRDPSVGKEAADSSLGAIERQMQLLVRLVDDLLDVARVSRGRLELKRARVDLRAALEQAVEAARPVCKDNEQELIVDLGPATILVDGDSARLAQAVGNLLSNSCKFTARGGKVHLAVGLERGHAVIRVSDNGVGIAADNLPRIFEIFSQLDTTLERAQGGLGIGLYLVKELVEMHGGRVEARSEGLGKGSEFVVHLPMLAEGAAESVGVSSGGESRPLPPASNLRRKVLVVDDNVDSADSLARLLRLRGYEVHVAYDGVEAVRVATEVKLDVAVLDIGLPRLNGYEAARQIRAHDNGRDLFLVAVTGWGQDTDRQRSREAGFEEHLVKPVDPNELEAILNRG
jgi:PAS domain S-box-containing protein